MVNSMGGITNEDNSLPDLTKWDFNETIVSRKVNMSVHGLDHEVEIVVEGSNPKRLTSVLSELQKNNFNLLEELANQLFDMNNHEVSIAFSGKRDAQVHDIGDHILNHDSAIQKRKSAVDKIYHQMMASLAPTDHPLSKPIKVSMTLINPRIEEIAEAITKKAKSLPQRPAMPGRPAPRRPITQAVPKPMPKRPAPKRPNLPPLSSNKDENQGIELEEIKPLLSTPKSSSSEFLEVPSPAKPTRKLRENYGPSSTKPKDTELKLSWKDKGKAFINFPFSSIGNLLFLPLKGAMKAGQYLEAKGIGKSGIWNKVSKALNFLVIRPYLIAASLTAMALSVVDAAFGEAFLFLMH